ncbi:hypothetical protein FOZ60_010440 [Perkinsus olseni]|uniref:Uncharacterized protein n=1 Tax=Perkinsus olseni TaxID=32597 RepID=A0A7J6NGB9_PEROL|nr:hypothetical protein FOZ60_010440 [Perkinsus olseni]
MVVRALSDTSSYTIALTSFTVVVVSSQKRLPTLHGPVVPSPALSSEPSSHPELATSRSPFCCQRAQLAFPRPGFSFSVVSSLSEGYYPGHYNGGSSSKTRSDGGGSLHNKDGPSCFFV